MIHSMNRLLFPIAILLLVSCQQVQEPAQTPKEPQAVVVQHVPAEALVLEADSAYRFELEVPETGRYRSILRFSNAEATDAILWIEDYVENPDGRTYNITSNMVAAAGASERVYKEGSPLQKGKHPLKVHCSSGKVSIDTILFEMMRPHEMTPEVLTASTQGEEWELIWSDEFDGKGLPDPSKWTYDVGNWGWGNNEPQYYTDGREKNVRMEGGNLIIEAHRNDMDEPWTSARLTTRGKTSFLYGKLEFRAKAPAGDGTWAAGWLLGDDYRDEISWPYCGEVDILECIGKEIDDETGDGINHGSCHTRAYYFKQNNHITNTIPVKDMVNTFHTYTAEWDSLEMRLYVDGEHYYTYDKTADRLEWPFDQPQNIIINLAMGGGMGGAIDTSLNSASFVLDYVRWYEKK
jgi:beta-glucanase (GH16 family)